MIAVGKYGGYKEIKSKDDVIKIAKLYFSRWRIEEYFRCKKQIPFIMVQEFPLCSQTDHIILVHGIQFEKHLVIVIEKINIVDRLSRHLSKGTPKDALNAYLTHIKKWAVGKYGGFCNMITFRINIFCSGTLRTIAYPAKRLKFITIALFFQMAH